MTIQAEWFTYEHLELTDEEFTWVVQMFNVPEEEWTDSLLDALEEVTKTRRSGGYDQAKAYLLADIKRGDNRLTGVELPQLRNAS